MYRVEHVHSSRRRSAPSGSGVNPASQSDFPMNVRGGDTTQGGRRQGIETVARSISASDSQIRMGHS